MHTVKENLARCLATENLIVEHRDVETAQFNVETRVLTLPVWRTNHMIQDLLIAHEVGHALYTPNDFGFLGEIPMQFVNVVEDIRVEKLMKRRYGGLGKTFYRGYQMLNDEDFFAIADRELEDLNLADRINLQYKIGNYEDVPFADDEKVFLTEADALETFEDCLTLAKKLYEWCKQEQEKQRQEVAQPPQQNSETEGKPQDQKTEEEAEEETEGQSEDQKPEAQDEGEDAPKMGNPDRDEPKVETASALDEALENLIDPSSSYREYDYLELPGTVDANIIVDNQDCHAVIEEYYEDKDTSHYLEMFDNFMTSTKKEVNYMVKEFEMKKSADAYARASVSRTGVLDTAKLHTYKYNEDLFKRVTIVNDGKSHGLVFNIDWSGSMHSSLLATVKQLITLITFCRKVNIAYDVYIFTDHYVRSDYYVRFDAENPNNKNGQLCVDSFNMVNILSSRTNNRVHQKQIKNLFVTTCTLVMGYIGCPHEFSLGGTPLNEAMVMMNNIIPEFKARNKVDKVHCITLTDGEGAPMCYQKEVKHYTQEGMTFIRRRASTNCYLRDRKTGKNYEFGVSYNQTPTFLNQLKDRFPECEFMNIRLLSSGEWGRYKRIMLDPADWFKADTDWKKMKTFVTTTAGWSIQYIMSANNMDDNAEFDVHDSATKSQIRSALRKTLKSKATNKKVLTSFIDRIS